MTERLTEKQKRILRPAIRERLSMPDDCDGCFDPLGNDLRRRVITYTLVERGEEPINAMYHFQHSVCFENGVPIRRRGEDG